VQLQNGCCCVNSRVELCADLQLSDVTTAKKQAI